MHTAKASRLARLLAGIVVVAACGKAAQVDACALLSPESIREAMGEAVAQTKATSQTAGKVRQTQCFYTLPTFSNSISVTLTNSGSSLWKRWFHAEEMDKDEDKDKKREPEEEEAGAKAVPVSGVGYEAYWVHSFVGNLYVRKGSTFFRISLGGKLNDEERQARAKALAAVALKKLR